MARRSLQLAAGVLLLVGLLGLSTALIAEVRDEVTERSQEAEDSPARQVQDPRSGLPVPELTLLDPTQAWIPDRETSDDAVRLTGSGHLRIDRGDAIQPAPLPVEGVLVLADGWDVDTEAITCTNPCRLETGGHELELPPNTTLVPPSGTGDVLAEAVLEPGARLPLPEGTELALPPVRFPSGTRLDLEPGAQVQPPGPRATWTSVFATDPVELPAGTVVERSTVAASDTERLAQMLDRARQDEAQPTADADPRPEITVTRTPEAITKGETFPIVGRVVTPDGDPSRHHPVTVYANASKHLPGIEIQTAATTTNAAGTFTAQALLPEDAPTRPYHILAHAHPQPAREPSLAGAWSDPVVPVRGEADLRLDLPDRAGVDVPLPLETRLLDAYGAPIPNQTVAFEVEDVDETLTARTGVDGRAHAVLPQGLPFPGNYTVHARFHGTGNITPDEDEASLSIVEARIQAAGVKQAPRGEPAVIEGRVLTEDGDPPEPVWVEASYRDVLAKADTDEEGRFTLELPVPADLAPGNHTVDLEASAVDAHHRMVLTATAGLRLETPALSPQPVGAHAPLPVTVRSDNGTAVPGVGLQTHAHDRIVDRAVSDEHGHARLSAPLPSTGSHTIRLRADPPPAYRSTDRALSIQAAPLAVDADLRVAPGSTANGTLKLTVDEAPLADVPLRLVGPGFVSQARTDEEGRAEVRLRAPPDAEPGLVTANLTLPDRGFATNAPVRVLDTPTLTVDVAEEGQEGRPVRLTVTAEGRQGPLSGVPVVARAEGAFQASDRAITGEDGTANLSLPRPDDAEGAVEIDVLARSTPTTAPNLATTSAEVTAAPLPWGWLLTGAAALALAGLVAARRRRRTTLPATPATDDASPISLRLAEQSPQDPPVWHPGEGTELVIEARDDQGHRLADRVELEGPDGMRVLDLDDQGRARAAIPARPQGTYAYRARLPDDPASETVVDVRVSDYREEIDRAYRHLRRTATRLGLVGPDATPRELARALGPPADELARRFERYDYSPQPVDRDDFERFMQLVREADPRA